jgi:PIN domain nuclease of toxin-antitoxin system
MEYLIDTHIIVWYLDGNTLLPNNVVDLLDNAEKIVVSIASLWELTIKSSLGKIELSYSFTELQNQLNNDKRFHLLDISFAHLNTLFTLTHFHRDPFDRLIISQAISEDLIIISADRHFSSYPVQIIW